MTQSSSSSSSSSRSSDDSTAEIPTVLAQWCAHLATLENDEDEPEELREKISDLLQRLRAADDTCEPWVDVVAFIQWLADFDHADPGNRTMALNLIPNLPEDLGESTAQCKAVLRALIAGSLELEAHQGAALRAFVAYLSRWEADGCEEIVKTILRLETPLDCPGVEAEEGNHFCLLDCLDQLSFHGPEALAPHLTVITTICCEAAEVRACETSQLAGVLEEVARFAERSVLCEALDHALTRREAAAPLFTLTLARRAPRDVLAERLPAVIDCMRHCLRHSGSEVRQAAADLLFDKANKEQEPKEVAAAMLSALLPQILKMADTLLVMTLLIMLRNSAPGLVHEHIPDIIGFCNKVVTNAEEKRDIQDAMWLFVMLCEDVTDLDLAVLENIMSHADLALPDAPAEEQWLARDHVESVVLVERSPRFLWLGRLKNSHLYRILTTKPAEALPILQSIAQKHLQDDSWNKRYTGLAIHLVIAMCCEDEREVVLADALARLDDPHALVRDMAVRTLRWLAANCSPTLRQKWNGRVMRGLLAVLSSDDVPRVAALAACALDQLLPDCPEDTASAEFCWPVLHALRKALERHEQTLLQTDKTYILSTLYWAASSAVERAAGQVLSSDEEAAVMDELKRSLDEWRKKLPKEDESDGDDEGKGSEDSDKPCSSEDSQIEVNE